MKRTPLKPFKRKEGVEYYPGTTIRKKADAKPIRKMSAKTVKRIKNYRADGFKKFGYKCFLCGREDPTGKTLDLHRPYGRINGDDLVVPLCNRFSGCKAHNHNGKDKRFKDLQQLIFEKLLAEVDKKISEDLLNSILGIETERKLK